MEGFAPSCSTLFHNTSTKHILLRTSNRYSFPKGDLDSNFFITPPVNELAIYVRRLGSCPSERESFYKRRIRAQNWFVCTYRFSWFKVFTRIDRFAYYERTHCRFKSRPYRTYTITRGLSRFSVFHRIPLRCAHGIFSPLSASSPFYPSPPLWLGRMYPLGV